MHGVAVTDHEIILGALKLAKQKQIMAIPGIEINSLHGHVLALNLTNLLAPKLSLTETIEKIHEMGGIARTVKKGAIIPFRKSLSWASRLERAAFYMRLRLKRR